MPYVVSRGAVVGFSIQFSDINDNLTVPSCATLIITYPTLSGSIATADIPLARGRVFTGQWDSSVSNLGNATIVVTGAGQTTPTTTTLRVVYP